MLEKIGLPSKPSQRGNNWVVDASHCQGCSSQFTFINRKHHCRRCGGLFCNSCSHHRMVLRGQGDSPVRICQPCKQLEEAARFEMRHGHKSRAGRGGSKLTPKDEDELLSQIFGEDGRGSFSSAREPGTVVVSGNKMKANSSSCSTTQESVAQDAEQISKSLSLDGTAHVMDELGATSPEELRQQAAEEKKKYKILKGEGKAEEALKAFKRGKELERQAGALELLVRKNRKKANQKLEAKNTVDIPKESGEKRKLSQQSSKENDDVLAELKKLGWSDFDVRDGDKKPASMSLEGELSTLIGEFSQKKNKDKGINEIDKSEVTALKRKALMLKREGRLTEAKEELKKAKILEKQLEEQEFFIEAEDSDDELSSLIRSMDADKENDFSVAHPDPSFDFTRLAGDAEDLNVDNFEVTDEDMNDPDIASALQSLGWAESHQSDMDVSQFAAIDREAVLIEIQSLKKEAVSQKRAGNTAEAMQLLKKAKLLDKDLESAASEISNLEDQELIHSEFESIVDDGSAQKRKAMNAKPAPKSRLMIQKELLALKKKALALRREGRVDEAEEELKKGRVLEQQLEEIDNPSNKRVKPAIVNHTFEPEISSSMGVVADEEGDVSESDLNDPAYLALLKNLGWKDDTEVESFPSDIGTQSVTSSIKATKVEQPSKRSKSEIQRELLGLKRKALALRRQGDTEGAEEILEVAKQLEAEITNTEEEKKSLLPDYQKENATRKDDAKKELRPNYHMEDETIREQPITDSGFEYQNEKQVSSSPVTSLADEDDASILTREGTHDEAVFLVQKSSSQMDKDVALEGNSAQKLVSQDDRSSLQQEILLRKRKAVALKREGKMADAREELRQAKLLEKHLEDRITEEASTSSADASVSTPDVFISRQKKHSSADASISTSDVIISGKKEHSSENSGAKPLSSRDRFKLQQKSLGHKRQALKLRREGRTEEADAEFELAKALETQLEASSAHDSASKEPVDDVGVEDFLDPQLLSSLKALGLDNVDAVPKDTKVSEPVVVRVAKNESSSPERAKLEESITAEKVKAVNLKRSGKQVEALAALRQAKLLEKKLNSMPC